MADLVGVERLSDLFAESEGRTPALVFALLRIYLKEGPFEFNAARLSERLRNLDPAARASPEDLASLQPELEKFFVPSTEGWTPRPGALALDPADASSNFPSADR